ncbi:MAG: hypothetical protein HQL05_12175 [Nitrospirae bacterium]|uniref:hypothetical protein n=1 Tax=Candidatus Magnetobacterium casense TaxID=1455061 RepID=UPI000590BF93|nr:hypothetical protein [Candidatus Magnetobacterium casensis]MBF0338573.1 hypothetical protein [Nitrospirota bacterium]
MRTGKNHDLVTLFVITAFLLTSCTTMLSKPRENMTDAERNAAKDECIILNTVGGAVLGGVLGGLTGGGRGAVQGAIAGGTIAFALAWGKCIEYYFNVTSKQTANYKETARNTGYEPKKGALVKIDNIKVEPSTVAPGKPFNFSAKYYVMDSETTKELTVTESRTVIFYDKDGKTNELGNTTDKKTIDPGTRIASGMCGMPEGMPEGRYKIVFEVSYNNKSDKSEVDIIVKK